jgi:hypothetical protein
VAHTCNPKLLRRQSSKPVQSQPGQIVHKTSSQKTLHKNKAGGVTQSESPDFKPQYCKKTEKKKRNE